MKPKTKRQSWQPFPIEKITWAFLGSLVDEGILNPEELAEYWGWDSPQAWARQELTVYANQQELRGWIARRLGLEECQGLDEKSGCDMGLTIDLEEIDGPDHVGTCAACQGWWYVQPNNHSKPLSKQTLAHLDGWLKERRAAAVV